MTMRQSTPVKTGLPPWYTILILPVILPNPLVAQARYEVARQENFRRAPDPAGRLLASLNQGTEVNLNDTRGPWMEVTIEGWVWQRSLRNTARDGFDLEIIPPTGENLRDAPSGSVIGRLRQGFLAEEVGRDNGWVRIRRTGWMFGQSLNQVGVPRSVPSASGPSRTPSADQVGLDYALTDRDATVFREAAGDTAGTMRGGLPVRIVSRAGDWVKIRTEGWVREEDLRSSEQGVLVGVSGAEVRATPGAFDGQTVQWRLQFLSVKQGTGLRALIPEGTAYMLARGPLPEASFVYVLLTPDQAVELERVSGITELTVLGRVLGVSRFLANPVLQLIEMQVRSR